MVVVSRVAGGLVRALLLGVFGSAGTVVGAAYGLLSGFVDDEDGFAQGTLLGALAGALVSLDLAHSLLTIWCRRRSSSSCTGRIKRTVAAVVELTTLADPQYCGRRDDRAVVGLDRPARSSSFGFFPPAAVTDAGGTGGCCPICLQEFDAGGEREGRRLPACSHVFHLECIRSWLLRKPHCPMCRHAVHSHGC
ncbi:hypothetical protein CFC21_027800 [Triticum aestivum]|uniref:RING-type domain-containing protein n=3 Tax=Triticinae TaxID=1648030 RepID=A0A9R1JE84_WHEAT|nr:NEP1-interacting protein 2 [Aegilops tauschii subsp. strangulata]XP_044330167.1 NEP1-interacting protein 2-like [Triticum aestivum]KAF7013734.1 hypothetical protein CFC21_027797 [Triticum aestivum]KAF7013737.1 hypothetical protein CFC21_027800 [Triticum aestivum]